MASLILMLAGLELRMIFMMNRMKLLSLKHQINFAIKFSDLRILSLLPLYLTQTLGQDSS